MVEKDKLSKTDKAQIQIFEAYLHGDLASDGKRRSATPLQALEQLMRQTMLIEHPVTGQTVEVTVQEGVIGKYVEKALTGDLKAIEGIFKELQHEGVSKHQITHETISPATKHVLEMVGVDAEAVLEADYTELPDEKAQLTHEQKAQDLPEFTSAVAMFGEDT